MWKKIARRHPFCLFYVVLQHPALLIILQLIILSSLSRTSTFRFLYTVLQQTSLGDYFAADHHHHYQEPTLMINSISGTLNPFSASAILRLRHLPRFSETELEHSFWCSFFGFRLGMHCGPDYTLSPMCPKKGSWGFLTERTSSLWRIF